MSRITIFSNYINHHQLPLCKQFEKITKNNFHFVSQKAISEKRIALGYQNISNDYPFVVKTYEDDNKLKQAYELADNSDYVIFGSSNTDYINNRLQTNKITFKYSERLFKKKLNILDYPKAFYRVFVNHTKYKNKKLYMLCSSAYAAYDFNRFGAYKNKTYKWAYFTESIKYNVEDLMKLKNHKVVNILWAGRLIDWKHPEVVIELGKKLKDNGYKFKINIIGQGVMEEDINSLIDRYNLNDCVLLLGSMKPSEVRKQMEKANIFLFTSNMQEGWGAVLNEAMNSGCACVASHAIGSVGFLINNGNNGLVYKDGDIDDLYTKVISLIDDKKKCTKIGTEAYKTIDKLWNAKVAAKRFMELAKCLEEGKDTPYTEGPCSKAYPISDDEMYNHLVK